MFEDLAQPNAEPVTDIDLAIDKVRLFRLERMDDGVIWIRLHRENGDDKVIWLNSSSAIGARVEDDKAESLHTAPPRPDASAGLVEAAEYLKCRANDHAKNWINDGVVSEALLDASEHLRARAADRSGK